MMEAFAVANSAIVIRPGAGALERRAADELQSYLRLLCGAELPVMDRAAATGHPRWILIGDADAVNTAGLKPDGFVLRTATVEGRPALVAAGNGGAAALYAVYELLERLGVVFQLTGDIVPSRNAGLAIPTLNVRVAPVIPYRGLHMRHFVMPWMGMEYFRKFLGQLAKMKCNYLEFYWYVGAPWISYSYRGEKKLIGDLYPKESGYTTWRATAATFGASDVKIGREHFAGEKVCAPEFQNCDTPEEAHRAARELLREVIRYAHSLNIRLWLGMGDCPGTPPNLGRHAPHAHFDPLMGSVVPAGDPAGVEIWNAALDSMVKTYPEADGYWLWLSEDYYHSADPDTKRTLAQYDRSLVPSLEEIKRIGYDRPATQEQLDADVGLLHYGRQLSQHFVQAHPGRRLGIAVLGRAYLFRALDAVVPREVAFSSMEASSNWNRFSKVPMHLFGDVAGREMFLIPRLDDDESELAMQFNNSLYFKDDVLAGSARYGLAGIAPQTGKTRGLEQNVKYVAEGCWNPSLTPTAFYAGYSRRLFGEAAPAMEKAFLILEDVEKFLGWRGFGNFINYADVPEILLMGLFKEQENPFDGPSEAIRNAAFHFHQPEHLDKNAAEPIWVQANRYKHKLFGGGVGRLHDALAWLAQARDTVPAGSRHEWEYLDGKTRQFISHLESLRALLAGFLSYAEAFDKKNQEERQRLLDALSRSEAAFGEARRRARATASMLASLIDDPSEQYILFRYNVRYLRPIEEFSRFIGNVVNYHNGQPYWERIEWDVIAPPHTG
jgi:hypothetical protein